MKFKKIVAILLSLASCLLLIVFLSWHFRIGMSRYFDADEFAHLSWAYQMLSGRRPYVDFLFFFPPGFHVFLMPLFAFGSGVVPILAGRVFAFIVFVLLVGVTMLLFWFMRRTPAPGGVGQGWTAILAGVILAFLPLPFDKFLEIRPDTLAMVFAMWGMFVQILALKGLAFSSKKVRPYLIISGACYGVSLLILPKTLPQVAVAALILILMDIGKKYCLLRCDRNANRITLPFIIGLGIPLTFFGLWVLTLGHINQVIYSLLTLPVEANKISATFIMMPDLFFYPNSIFYGDGGWSRGLIVNHIIWIVAILVGSYRLFVPTSGPNSKLAPGAWNLDNQSTVWAELLIAATFFVHIIFYVMIVPLKHTQYLIPIAVFVAFYAADGVDMVWQKIKVVNLLTTAFLLTTFAGFFMLWNVFVRVNAPKLAWTNADTVKQLTALYQTISPREYVLDLIGATIYYKHPYTVCCLPFGQFAPYLSRPLPSLAKALEETGTKYVYQGGLDRLSTLLPQDKEYIMERYLPHPAIGGLLVRTK